MYISDVKHSDSKILKVILHSWLLKILDIFFMLCSITSQSPTPILPFPTTLPLVTTGLFSVSVSLFLFVIFIHWFFRFHTRWHHTVFVFLYLTHFTIQLYNTHPLDPEGWGNSSEVTRPIFVDLFPITPQAHGPPSIHPRSSFFLFLCSGRCHFLSLSHISSYLQREPSSAFMTQLRMPLHGLSAPRLCVQHACMPSACPILCHPMDYSPPGSSVHGFPDKNTGVGCHFLLKGSS